MTTLNRRTFLASAAAVGGAGLLGARPAIAAPVDMRSMWWGSADRTRRTNEVADLYLAKTGRAKITGEVVGDYWPKLATQMAAKNVADVFQLEPGSLSDYAGRGACMPIDEFVGKELDISSFGEKMVNLCRARGKLWGVALGLNSFSHFYDQTVFEKIGLPVPTKDTTWEDYAKLAVEITKAVNQPGYAGAPYGGRYHYVFDIWLRQRGKQLFLEEGKLGCNADDVKEWFTYWEALRKAGGTVSADIQTQDKNQIDSNAFALGKSAMGFTYSNQLVGYQLLTKNKVGITMVPRQTKGGPSGHYYRPGLIWSIAANCKTPKEAAAYISFFVNDVDAGKILGVERGVPMSPKVREAIAPSLNETERATIDYVASLADQVSSYPPPAPVGAVEFDANVMRKVADQVAFGRMSIAEAAVALIEDGNDILRKAQ